MVKSKSRWAKLLSFGKKKNSIIIRSLFLFFSFLFFSFFFLILDFFCCWEICFYFVISKKVSFLFWEKHTNHRYELGDHFIFWVLWAIFPNLGCSFFIFMDKGIKKKKKIYIYIYIYIYLEEHVGCSKHITSGLSLASWHGFINTCPGR